MSILNFCVHYAYPIMRLIVDAIQSARVPSVSGFLIMSNMNPGSPGKHRTSYGFWGILDAENPSLRPS